MENRVCESQEMEILRAFESKKEGLKYLQKLPLEEKIALSKNLIVNCMETFGEQVYISFSGGKDSTVLSSLVCSVKSCICFRIRAVNTRKRFLLLKKNARGGRTLYPCILSAGMAQYGPLSV